MNRLATLGFGLALCGVFFACGSDGGTSSSEENNPEFESSSSADENLSSSQNLITSSSTGTSTEKLSSAKLENSSSSTVDESGSSGVVDAESAGSSSSVFDKSSSSVSSDSNPAGDLNSDGTFTDSRNGRVYKTVKVGNQVWMAENLNFETAQGSACYGGDAGYCEVFGRLYSWDAAKDACPEGWILPSELDWYALVDEVGDADLRFSLGWVGMPPKNDYGFAVLAAGYGSYGNFSSSGYSAIFWTATENCKVGGGSCEESVGFIFGYEDSKPSRNSYEKEILVSVRCMMESGGNQVNSSSSASLVDPSTVVKGSMTDARDGKTYKTVTIGTQTWMAENLNYAYNHPTATLDSSSVCFENNPESCAQFGRLYLWSAAMDSAAVFGTAGKHCGYADEGNWDHVCERPNLKTRGACPEGWHIPSRDEWNVLFSAVGDRFTAAPKLKATDGWVEDGNGTDDYGFSAVPTGFWEDPDRFGGAGESTKFWASTEDNGYNAWEIQIDFFSYVVEFWPGSKKYGAAVRCVKD